MSYKGDVRLGGTYDFKFTSRAFATGIPTTLAGSPVISAYVDNGTTQITAGITLTVDFDGVTGYHNIRVVATSGNGYAAATNVSLTITAGTVGGVSVVGEEACDFSIENRSALMPTTAARTLDVTAAGNAGIDWANVENPTTALNLSGTNIDTDQAVASVSGAVGSVTGAVGSVTGNVGGTINGLTATAVGNIWTTTLTESYAANGAQFTGAQALYSLQQWQQMFAITGTGKAVKKLDGITTAFTGTFNDSANPTASTRS